MNGALPAWLFMPFRTICDSKRTLSTGHFSREAADAYMEKHQGEEFRLLTDEDSSSKEAKL